MQKFGVVIKKKKNLKEIYKQRHIKLFESDIKDIHKVKKDFYFK